MVSLESRSGETTTIKGIIRDIDNSLTSDIIITEL